MSSFSFRLTNAIRSKKTPVLVGLDPRWNMLPKIFTEGKKNPSPSEAAVAFESFCRNIIDIVSPLVPIVKPQSAFFEQYGPEGMICLQKVIQYASKNGLLVLLDAKRNDIGSTASAYAAGLIGSQGQSPWGADALTVSPYLGDDSLIPFAETARAREAGIFILVKTSNPGGALFQDLLIEGKPLYRRVADFVEKLAAENREDMSEEGLDYSSIGGVVGATWPDQLTELRKVMKRTWFLVPGYGNQGGGAKDVAGAFDEAGLGAIINNSRGILFAHQSKKYAETFGESRWEDAVEAATKDMIAALAAETPAGRL
ncbi:MAG: orotidine-5'-phosphate decarboxylase [Planctomycetia bacterium]|nr:orotidine-5'-phosphate decarboxylase [Planctomycetia bacterium]